MCVVITNSSTGHATLNSAIRRLARAQRSAADTLASLSKQPSDGLSGHGSSEDHIPLHLIAIIAFGLCPYVSIEVVLPLPLLLLLLLLQLLQSTARVNSVGN